MYRALRRRKLNCYYGFVSWKRYASQLIKVKHHQYLKRLEVSDNIFSNETGSTKKENITSIVFWGNVFELW